MIHSNQKIINILNMTADTIIVFFSYFLALKVRFVILPGHQSHIMDSAGVVACMALYSVVLVISFYLLQMYGSYRFTEYLQEISYILAINGAGIIILMALLFVFKFADFSRLLLVIFWAISSFIMIFKRYCVRKILKYYNILGYSKKNAAIIGNGKLAHQFLCDVEQSVHSDIEIKGYISGVKKAELGTCLGNYEELEQIIYKNNIEELIVALEYHESDFMPYIFDVADKEGVGLRIIPFYNNYFPKNALMESVGKTKLINVRVIPLDNIIWAIVKRAVDILGSAFGLIVLSPLFLITAIGVKLSSPGPVFFKQNRIGKDKKPFKMYKFRSMCVNEQQETAWSTNTDSRKTAFGSFIRKYSIDELPQLFNVLKGDMSLVGPRPEIPFYVRQFKEKVPLYLLRHQVRPGMTGWAQIHGLRGDTSIEARVEYDIWYIENWSIWLDIKILWKTLLGGWKNNEVIVLKDKETV